MPSWYAGIELWLGVFRKEQPVTLYWRAHTHTIGFFWTPSITHPSQSTLSRSPLAEDIRLNHPSSRSPLRDTRRLHPLSSRSLRSGGLLMILYFRRRPSTPFIHFHMVSRLKPTSPPLSFWTSLAPRLDKKIVNGSVLRAFTLDPQHSLSTPMSRNSTRKYVWTTLAHRRDNKKLNISKLILSRRYDTNL